MGAVCASASSLRTAVAREGYAFARGGAMRETLAVCGPLDDWGAFADSWNALALDTYMADGGRYRRRRHAVFEAEREGPIRRAPHQPHFQPLEYNPLNGGIPRWFEPVAPEIGRCASLQTILRFCREFFGSLAPHVSAWRIEIHQFRIEARPGEEGRPTPEGLHRDGVDYVLVLLIRRRNIASGTTSVYALDGRRLGAFTLSEPFDAALLDDARVAHGVTPVQAIDPAQPAHRDVLVVTFAASDRSA